MTSALDSARFVAAEVSARALDGFALIGIDGPGGSGKSTLAAALAHELRGPRRTRLVTVVHGDDFYRETEPAARLRMTAAEGYERYFDWERLRSQVLVPLTSGHPASYQRYDWESGRIAPDETHEVPNAGYVIVEGVFTLRPELQGYFDVAVFVDTPLELCLQRLVAREHDHGPEDWHRRWQEAEKYYFAMTDPWERIDIVVKGT